MAACMRTIMCPVPARNVAALFTCAKTRKEAMQTASVETAGRRTGLAFTRALSSLRRKQEFLSMSNLNFDQYQFAGRYHRKAVGAEFTQNGWTSNGISYEDYVRMESRPSS